MSEDEYPPDDKKEWYLKKAKILELELGEEDWIGDFIEEMYDNKEKLDDNSVTDIFEFPDEADDRLVNLFRLAFLYGQTIEYEAHKEEYDGD